MEFLLDVQRWSHDPRNVSARRHYQNSAVQGLVVYLHHFRVVAILHLHTAPRCSGVICSGVPWWHMLGGLTYRVDLFVGRHPVLFHE